MRTGKTAMIGSRPAGGGFDRDFYVTDMRAPGLPT